MSDKENAVPGPEETPEPELVNPDDVVLSDAAVSQEALEPELTVSPEELALTEPSLEPARISEETAEAASLEAAAAEARAVAKEAEEAGTLVAGPLPAEAPVVEAAPSGTAPAGGAAGDTETPDPADETNSSDPTGGTGASDTADGTGASEAVHVTRAPGSMEAVPGSGDSGETPRPAADTPVTAAGTDDSEGADSGLAAAGAASPVAAGAAEVPVTVWPAGPGLGAGTDPAAVGASENQGGGAPHTAGVPAAPADSAASAPADSAPADSAPADSTPPARTPWIPDGEGPSAGPVAAGAHPIRPRNRKSSGKRPVVLILAAALVLIALLVWAVVALVARLSGPDASAAVIPTTAGADGIIAEDVSTTSVEPGQCLLDFSGADQNVTIVTCTTPHHAQLLASEFYPDDADFPGRDQLGARAKAACDAADINEGAAAAAGEITLLHVTPTEGSWADDDRRVDCFAVSEAATLSRSLLN